MIKKVIAIGDSFFAGVELEQKDNVWPCLYAKYADVNFKNMSRGGCGGKFVLKELLTSIKNEKETCFYILLWPYLSRRDFYDQETKSWYSIGPTAHTLKKPNTSLVESFRKHYYADICSSVDDQLSNLITIHHALLALQQTDHKWAMHVMDDETYAMEHHNSDPISNFQKETLPFITFFEKKLNFVDWSKKNNFNIGSGGHPLENAHQHAFEHFKPMYDKIIGV